MCQPIEPIEAIRDWNTLREVAVLGYQDAILSLAMLQAVQRWNSPATKGAIETAQAGRTAQLLIDGLLFRTHIFITRAFARVGRKDDRHLRAAIEFLKREESLDMLPPPQDSERLKRAVSEFEDASQNDGLARLKKMRDKQLAHMASYKSEAGPTINDLFEMTKLTSDIWENLAIGSATIFINLEIQLQTYKRSADRFWSKFDGVRIMTDDDEQFDLA